MNSPLEDIQSLVLQAVENFTRGASQADDVTLLLVRYRTALVAGDTDIPPLQPAVAAD